MSTPSNQAQPEQIINLFKHRLNIDNVRDPLDVQDAFNLIADQAKGVLELLYTQFGGDGRVSDEIILNSIDSVLYQIDDLKAIINTHINAGREGSK
jgi:hypothetical protein